MFISNLTRKMESRRMLILFLCLSALLFVAEAVLGPTQLRPYCETVNFNEQLPKSCLDFLCWGYRSNGVYRIYPTGKHGSFEVYCDQTTDGGGWTVFQRRMDGTVDFYRNYRPYQLGFGDVKGEFWLGHDNLRTVLGTHATNELRVDLEAVDNVKVYAKYTSFSVGDENSGYHLDISGYNGTAGDSMTTNANGQRFSTKDRDEDTWPNQCAVSFHGAWWYKACHRSNLNGAYLNGTHTSFANGVNWHSFRGYYESLKTTEMKFRGNLF